jgi:Fibronectin type III domain
MKLSQKAKYFIYGVVAVGVLVPLAIKAVESVPITFGKGDVISANVLNNLFSRISISLRGFSSNDDILGTYSCTTYTVRTDCTGDFVLSSAGQLYQKTQNVIFSKSGSTYSISADWMPGNCTSTGPNTKTSNYDLHGTMLTSFGGIQSIQRLSPDSFVWGINSGISGGGVNSYAVCSPSQNVPAPPTTLAISYSNGSATLTWTDANGDNTGYIVQRSTDSGTTWTTINTITSAATLTYTDSGLTSGTTYQYRVLATNANGNSIGSSVVQAAL